MHERSIPIPIKTSVHHARLLLNSGFDGVMLRARIFSGMRTGCDL